MQTPFPELNPLVDKLNPPPVKLKGKEEAAWNWFVNNRFFWDVLRPSDNKISELRKTYKLEVRREPPFEGASNIHIPLVRWMVDTLTVRLHTAHFNQQPYILLRPYNTEREASVSALESVLFSYQRLSRRADSFYPIILDAVLLGTGVGHKRWVERGSRSYPYLQYVPLEDFICYPNYSEQILMGHRELVSLRYLQKEYELTEELAEKLNKGLSSHYAQSTDSGLDLVPETGWGVVLLAHIYFWYEDELYEVHYLPFYGEALLFRKYHFPVFPYVVMRLTPRTQSIFGEGVGRLLLNIEQEITELHNIRLDNHILTNMPVFKVRKGSSAAQVQHMRPGMKIPVETPTDIDILLMPQQLGQGIMQEEQQLLDYAKLVGGVSELMSGQPPSPYHTAYAVEATLLEGSVRFKLMFHFSREALRQDALLDLLFIRKFSDPLFEQRLTDKLPASLDFTEEEIMQETEFIIEPNTSNINKETDRQRWLMIRQLFYDQLSEAGRWTIDSIILRQMGIVNPESILGQKPDGVAPVVEEQAPMGAPMGEMGSVLPPELLMQLQSLIEQGGIPSMGGANIQAKEAIEALGEIGGG